MTAAASRREGFSALRHRGYRIYFAGMLGRGTSVWMQFIAIPWVAVERDASPIEVGVVSACLFLPTIVVAPFGGVVADRMNRSAVLIATQLGGAVHAVALALLVSAGVMDIPLLAVFALLFGVLSAAELPVRQSYLTDLVPPEEISSAVSLHATAWNITRFLGPGVAGLLIATVGIEACFGVAAVACVLVAVSVLVLRRFDRHRRPLPAHEGSVLGALGDGVRFAIARPRIRWALVLLSSGGVFGIQAFQTLAPLYVSQTLRLGGGAFGGFMSAWGAGALAGAFAVTLFARGDRQRWLLVGAASLAALLAALSFTSWPPAAFAIAAGLGLAQISLVQNAMITVQQSTTDEFRGRVMGLYATVFQGTNPLGAILAGALGGTLGISGAMFVGAVGLGAIALAAAYFQPTREPALSISP
jgi:MFS family permease